MAWRRLIAAVFVLNAVLCGAIGAAGLAAGEIPVETTDSLRAGTFLSAPFVMPGDNGGYTGMAMELWHDATTPLGLRTEYIVYETWGDLLDAVKKGDVDVAIGAVTVSHSRAESMHFSFPWYDGGMRILRKAESMSFLRELVKSQRFQVYGLFCLLFALLALLMTWFRRRRDPEFPEDLPTGYTLSLLDITSSMRSGEMEQEYLGWKGNILSALWMMFGLGLVAYVTSTMTTAMTTVHLDKDGIYGIADLPGKKVAGLRGGMSMRYLRELHLDVVGSKSIEDAVEKLLNNQVQAVVSDAPVLEHWVYSHPEQSLTVVGELFHPDKYAFAANQRYARTMDRITTELIRLSEEGRIDQLKQKYLGDGHGYLYRLSEL